MLRIFVDTCVWRHWFTFTQGKPIPTEQIKQHCMSFQTIYDLVYNSQNKARFLYNQCIKNELGKRFEKEFNEKVLPVAEAVLIPLTRYDGSYAYDGSISYGGRIGHLFLGGHSIRDLLFMDGSNHEENIQLAAKTLKESEFLHETKPRKKEFDIEHMESALEAGADLFLTNDERTILEKLGRVASKYKDEHPINMIFRISKTPTLALPYVHGILGEH